MSERFGIFAVADATGFELTYRIPDGFDNLERGQICVLPVRERQCVGVFLGVCQPLSMKCRDILGVVPYTKPFAESALKLTSWLAWYYLAPVGRCIRLLAPGFLWDAGALAKREKRFAKVFAHASSGSSEFLLKAEKKRSLRGEQEDAKAPAAALREEQAVSLEAIFTAEKQVILLHGVTGSGKTEVYLRAAHRVVESGKTVLVLVPEIALTPQMTSRFRALFGESLCVLHSMLTPVEYEREWFKVHLGFARVVLGVRSAVFAPLRDVGLIIVDEEHDQSYKCDEFPCYNARDVAVKRASLEGSRCVLGSATPSLETWFNVECGRYAKTVLAARHSGHLPQIEVVNAREHLGLKPMKRSKDCSRSSLVRFEQQVVAEPVLQLIRSVKLKGEQSMVVLNRRGYASYAMCTTCGAALRCPNCSVSTTLHEHCTVERCHYCSFQRHARAVCPDCGSSSLVAMGAGTQSIEREISEAAPHLRVSRLDRDVITSNTRMSEILRSFREGEIDCLVGTQLLSKGHDFPRVTLVAVLHVEDGLFLPDFRASERTFQLLMQTAGRAGRGSAPGTVVVQSLVTGHPVVEFALHGEVERFLARELQMRKLGWHPPVTRQILLEFSDRVEAEVLNRAQAVRDRIVDYWKTQELPPEEVRIAGPHPATLERLRDVFRMQICITALKKHMPASLVPRDLLEDRKLARKMRIDVDPYSFM